MTSYSVFDSDQLINLADEHRAVFQALGSIESNLNKRFMKMEDPILCLVLAVASGEAMLFKGSPGTAKSLLVRSFCRHIGIEPEKSGVTKSDQDGDTDYFEYLLTPFTEPGELFGYYNMAQAANGKLERDFQGMMQSARVVYLDEVFKGSSAILNSLLAFMNERVFHDRGQRIPVKLQCLFSATNEVPYTSELRAIYDRFLLRCDVGNVDAHPRSLQELLNKGWQETYGALDTTPSPQLLGDLAAFRDKADKALTTSHPLGEGSIPFLSELSARINVIREHDLSQMSNRRLVKLLRIMMIHRVYQAAKTLNPNDKPTKESVQFTEKEIGLLRFMLDRRDEFAEEHLRLEV